MQTLRPTLLFQLIFYSILVYSALRLCLWPIEETFSLSNIETKEATNVETYNLSGIETKQAAFNRMVDRIPTQSSMNFYEALKLDYASKGTQVFEYRGVSGLGHRLMRQAALFHAAKVSNTSLMLASWGWECGPNKLGHPDIHDHLFGIGPLVISDDDEDDKKHLKNLLALYNKTDLYNNTLLQREWNVKLKIINEVPGYNCHNIAEQFHRLPKNTQRELFVDRAISDQRFYRQLRALFRFNNRIKLFIDKHKFSERIVLGFHIRSGNGEAGDFKRKNRGIEDIDNFLVNLANTTHQLVNKIQSAQYKGEKETNYNLSPLVFIATDDPLVVDKFVNTTQVYGISVISFPQSRLSTGNGVSYYTKFNNISACDNNWINQFIDASLLATADAVVAARYSSFSQAVPLVTVLSDSILDAGRQKQSRGFTYNATSLNSTTTTSNRFAHRLFCEINRFGDGMRCYDDYIDWCMQENEIFVPTSLIWNKPSEKFVRYNKLVVVTSKKHEGVTAV